MAICVRKYEPPNEKGAVKHLICFTAPFSLGLIVGQDFNGQRGPGLVHRQHHRLT
jgi:hypothetical protein